MFQAALLDFGFTVYLDESQLKGGDAWAEGISDAVVACAAFIAVISPTYGKRYANGAVAWTLKELTMAETLGKPVRSC
jgi:hypothetical protein